jgi:hypothetical protein
VTDAPDDSASGLGLLGRLIGDALSSVMLISGAVAGTAGHGPSRRIEGAIGVYLLLGFSWAHAYGLVALWDPGPFTGAVDSAYGSCYRSRLSRGQPSCRRRNSTRGHSLA